MPTLIIDNFTGNMVPQQNGDINSGNSYWLDVFGYDPFTKPRSLTWNEQQTQIDSAGSVITDLVLAGKVRVESGIIYVYCVGHTGRVYKIQVNDPNTSNPDYDNPVLLATLASGSPTFLKGAFIDFFGSTERMYISHDKGVTRLDFDGTNETVVGVEASWTQNVPKPMQQFLGNLYVGHGVKLAEIASGGTVNTYSKLSPEFPIRVELRDMKLTIDGNYLQMVATEPALSDITSTTPDISLTSPSNSFVFKWNGIDTGTTSQIFFPNVVLSACAIGSNSEYYMGYDNFSTSVYTGSDKTITSLPDVIAGTTSPSSVFVFGNQLIWGQSIFVDGQDWFIAQVYGSLDKHYPNGFWATHFHPSVSPETDIINVPLFMLVSNVGRSAGTASGYTNNYFMSPKVYYSTIETSTAPTTKYRFYKWSLYPTGQGTPIDDALFQTQNQVFSKKISVKEVRVYGQPWVTNNAFTIDLIGSDDAAITGGTQAFTAGTNLTVGDDFAWYNPAMKPIYSLGLRITNNGTKNFVIHKVEIDYEFAGK